MPFELFTSNNELIECAKDFPALVVVEVKIIPDWLDLGIYLSTGIILSV